MADAVLVNAPIAGQDPQAELLQAPEDYQDLELLSDDDDPIDLVPAPGKRGPYSQSKWGKMRFACALEDTIKNGNDVVDRHVRIVTEGGQIISKEVRSFSAVSGVVCCCYMFAN